MKATNIKTEFLVNPLGIDTKAPRITWTAVEGNVQTAYQISARINNTTTWDSGKVFSNNMNAIFGAELKSRDEVVFTITLFDENDKAGEPSEAHFEMGLLTKNDFRAKWITGNYKVNKKKRYPVDYFQKQFSASNIVKARLYVTACGLYEARLNGERIGHFVLAPGFTDYKKRIQLQTYDVTPLLKSGINTLNFELSDGLYRGSSGTFGHLNQYGTETKLYAQLELTDKEGKIKVIGSDATFKWSNDGPLLFADIKDGEIVDERLAPSYSRFAKETTNKVLPTASNNVPIIEQEVFKPKIIKTPSGKTILDFGQNIAGYVSFKLNAKAGQRLFLRFGEMIGKDGEFTQKNFQASTKKKTSPLQQIEYFAKEGVNEYKTKFAIFGFQYMLVETDIEFKPEDFSAIAVYSGLKTVFTFDSSNELLNKFVDATLWSAKGNFADNLTDCPTRERHGWTGDAHIFTTTAIYMFDFNAFGRKYIRDMYDWQKKSGRLPQIVPPGGVDFYMWPMNGSVGWSDAGIMMPYRLWKHSGDESILSEYYERMKLYAKFMIRRIGKKTLLSKPLHLKKKDRKFAVNYGQSYGEWAEPKDVFPTVWTDMILPHPEVSTAYTSYVMALMEEIALHLGKKEDAALYRKYKEATRKSYQAIRRTKEYSLDTDRQAELVRPLYFNLLDKSDKEFAEQRLIKAMDNYDWRVGTGFLSTPLILYVLADINIKYAYRLLENEKMPGWLFIPKHGGTTVWESWEGTATTGMTDSLNHYSKGAVCEWLFTTMCGVNITGTNEFVIAPKPGGTFTYATFSYESVYGTVSSGWKKSGSKTHYTISIPANTRAKIKLVDGTLHEVGPGTYEYTTNE